jgi:hypothetical protein
MLAQQEPLPAFVLDRHWNRSTAITEVFGSFAHAMSGACDDRNFVLQPHD